MKLNDWIKEVEEAVVSEYRDGPWDSKSIGMLPKALEIIRHLSEEMERIAAPVENQSLASSYVLKIHQSSAELALKYVEEKLL